MQLSTFSYAGTESEPLPTDMDSDATLGLVFGASSWLDQPQAFEDLQTAFPRSRFVGCSTAGEILGTALTDDTLVVALLRLERSRVRIATSPITALGSFAAGSTLGGALAAPDLRAVLIFSDGLQVNGSELVRGLTSVLPPHVQVSGGLAGDGDRFIRTWALVDGMPQSGVACAAGLYGDQIVVGHGSQGGWDMFGPERRVTRSAGNVLYELDGRPALELYKTYLGDLASGLPASALLFPLALRHEASTDKSLVRTVLAVDEGDQSMTFAGDIPQGSLAQLMRANFDRLIDGASEAGKLAGTSRPQSGECLSLAVSCVGRRLVLGERAEEEIEATLEALPGQIQQIGFYSYGEFSPHASGGCDLHNQTMTLTTIGELAVAA